jgi:hypothetical protein
MGKNKTFKSVTKIIFKTSSSIEIISFITKSFQSEVLYDRNLKFFCTSFSNYVTLRFCQVADAV